jgi:ribosomal-protein-alanine N-acetyltransferase
VNDTPFLDLVELELLTPRLVLRPLVSEDLDEFLSLMQSPGIHEGTLTIPTAPDHQWATERLHSAVEQMQSGTAVSFGVRLREPQSELIGNFSVSVHASHRRGHLGYTIGESRRGKGYATEALRAVAAWSFDVASLHRLCASTWPWNEASARLLRRVGFTCEGRSREHFRKDGGYCDADDWGMLADDPRP